MEDRINDQQQSRLDKLEKLIEMGINPYGERFDIDCYSKEIIDKYKDFSKEELEDKSVVLRVAGRIMTKRRMGKLGFMHLLDRDGQIQVVVNKAIVSEEKYELFKMADIGDIVGISGVVFKTNTGELSIRANNYIHLTKALRPLPEKFHGLVDIEERYRRRYLDLITNEDSRYIAITRPKIIRAIQNFFDNKGLIEVETPILHSILGGAAAKPFITYHNTLDMNFYLRIATELPLKRLIVGGLSGVYEIGRLFRNEGMDATHNPEFTSVEAYIAFKDMNDMMELCESLFQEVSMKINNTTELEYKGHSISLKAPFKRIRMVDMIRDTIEINFDDIRDLKQALLLAKQHDITVLKHQESIGHIISLFFDKYCEDNIIEPTFVYDYPIEISPLAKYNSKDHRYSDRFELFINGKEYANAFSELNDPIDQKERFEMQLRSKELGDLEATEMDIDYIEALEYGLPPTGGIGIGIDRLVMLLTNKDSIREVILFPHMKHR